MKYLDFKNKIQDMPLFSSQALVFLGQDEQILRNQIRRWQDKGLLLKLKRGLYILNKSDRKINPSRLFIANELYNPSYISLEYALNFYGLIPERVVDVTSVTTRKTKEFSNELGTFIYRHIKNDCFRGFKVAKDEMGLSYFMAEPEKAVVDFLYFNLYTFKKDFLKAIKESYRFQNLSSLKKDKILKLAGLFKNRKLQEASRQFCVLVRKEGR